jgi:hypothetical protein
MSVRLLILMAAVVTSCARPPMRVGLPAPNPNGCYVMMYERPEFQGVGDVLNGPGRWATLEACPARMKKTGGIESAACERVMRPT